MASFRELLHFDKKDILCALGGNVPRASFTNMESTCLLLPNVPAGTSGCAERICLHRDGCAPMRSAYTECPDTNVPAHPGQDGGCRS